MQLTLTQREFLINFKRSKFTKPVFREPMDLVVDKIREEYNENDFDKLQDFIKCQNLIMGLGKTEKFEDGDRVIEIAERTLKTLKGEPRQMGNIFLYPSFAYYAKKQKKNLLAQKYITLIVENDDALTEKYPVLHLHKLQHIINLNQVFLATKDYRRCADFMASMFKYLYSYDLDAQYGIGGKEFFEALHPYYSLSDATANFMDEYFTCIWKNPKVLGFVLENESVQCMLLKNPPPDEFTSALRELWLIQKSFKNAVADYERIQLFFDKFDSYVFDPLRLLILKDIYHSLGNENDRELVMNGIMTKLNFKYPEKLIANIDVR